MHLWQIVHETLLVPIQYLKQHIMVCHSWLIRCAIRVSSLHTHIQSQLPSHPHSESAPFTPTFRVSSLHTHIQSQLPSHPHSESAPFTPTFRVSSLHTHIHVQYHISKPCYHYYPIIIIIIIIILFTCMYTYST